MIFSRFNREKFHCNAIHCTAINYNTMKSLVKIYTIAIFLFNINDWKISIKYI